MKIVHLVIDGSVAGGQLVALRLARAAREHEHDVSFVSPTAGPFLELLEAEGFAASVLPMRGALDLEAVFRLRQLLRRERAHVLHTHGHFGVNVVGRLAGALAGTRIVVHMHAENAFRSGAVARAVQVALDNGTARLASRIVAVSDATRESLLRQGYPPERTIVIRNGIDEVEDVAPAALDVPDGAPSVLEIGRLCELKGQRDLIGALALLERGDAILLLAGDDLEAHGRFLDELDRRATALGVRERVRFLGHHPDVPGLIAAADVVALPSRSEGFGLALLEAMAQGKPVVATRVGGIPELVADGETGLLVPPGDVRALAAAVDSLLADPEQARRLGENGRRRARTEFSAAAAAERVLELYEEVAGANGSQSDVRRWWTEHPMTYDWRGEIGHEEGSAEHLEEVERRFLHESWFAQANGDDPYSALIPFGELDGKDVLEIGCGTGVHARLLAEAGARVTAIDLTPTAVELTRRRLELHGLDARVLEADAERLPFADGSFDFAWSWGVIHHSADTERVVAEIARVLRPGGRVALMVYHRSSITYWIQYQLIRGVLGGGLLRESPAEIANRYSDGVIARHYTRDELAALLSPFFERVETKVMGQLGEAVPLPAQLRAPVEDAVPLSSRKRVLRRWGWFLVASGVRRS
jgi:glycosyltransferase involved in cell wall biosynthesis/SAM-dependent methyltransferase